MPGTKPLPPFYLFAALVAMGILHFALPLCRLIAFPWNLAGLPILATGVWLALAADRLFTQHGTTVKPFERSSALVTTGPFRISRHPMYLGFTLVLLGVALLAGSLSPFAVVVLFLILMEALFIRTEERMMGETFGDAWTSYARRVRRWL
jgi:protein-S-isoprenylcysteine O-methyltransferase Ste14